MDFLAFQQELNEASIAKRKQIWASLPQRLNDHPLSPSAAKSLRAILLKESDLDVRTTGILVIPPSVDPPNPLPRTEPQEGFQSWLFHAFRPALGEPRASAKRSLVVSVCDREYIRDVQAQVEVARHLPADLYPYTRFQHLALHSPEWSHVGLDGADAICFIGRPSLFKGCNIIDHFPNDLHFSIVPPDSDQTGAFYRVSQSHSKTPDTIYPTSQDASKRHDHALVQRFMITVGGRKVTVVVIAGGSSLGTLGAAQWITRFDWSEDRRKEFVSVADATSNGLTTRVEALLSVTATVHNPARPWKADIEEKCLYFNKSRNLLRAPKRISVATDTGVLKTADDVRYLLFDDDEVDLAPLQNQAAVAVCVKYCLDHQTEMPIAKLMADKRVWVNGAVPDRNDPAGFFRDHLQRRSFNGIIEVSQSQNSLNLRLGNGTIEVIQARSNGSPMTIPRI